MQQQTYNAFHCTDIGFNAAQAQTMLIQIFNTFQTLAMKNYFENESHIHIYRVENSVLRWNYVCISRD